MFPWKSWGQAPDPIGFRSEDGFWGSEVDKLIGWLERNAVQSVVSTQGEVSRHLDAVRNYLVRIPDEVFEQVRAEIQTGHRNGDSIPAIADRVEKVLVVTGSENWANRAQTIAVTEVNGASNAGWFAGAVKEQQQLGRPLAKKWIATHDTHTRPDHREADGQTVPLLSPFIVGVSPMLYPGDKAGPPEEIINCRCTAAVVEP
jgi:uncharacterized protein with gpF-like domain